MALVRTDVSSVTGFNVTSIATAAFTPANNSLLVVQACLQSSSFASLTISGGSLTWTLQKSSGLSTDGFGHENFIWTAPVGTGASMTVTVSGMAAGGEGVVDTAYYTEYDTGTPVGATAAGAQAASGSPFNITLSGAPALTSEVIGCASGDTSGGASIIGVGSGFTTQFHTNNANDIDSLSETRIGSTSTTVGWTSTSAGVLVGAAIEIRQASAGASVSQRIYEIPQAIQRASYW